VQHVGDGEPTVVDVDQGAELAREYKPDVVIGLGGGSSMDTAKAIAVMMVHPGSVADYLEGVGSGQITHPGIPFIAIPTTAGTGAEVTKNAVITGSAQKYKKSLRSEHLVARVALLDPELTVSLPGPLTAETGMDAYTQLIESYISLKAQPIPQALALYGVPLVDKYLGTAVRHGSDLEAREAMLLAGLLSGIALANSGLGAAHGIAAALGAVCGIPHGRACAMLLPKVLEFNLPSCITPYCQLYGQLTTFTVDSELAAAEAFVNRVERLSRDIGIPQSFTPAELPVDKVPEVAAASFGSSMSGNPVKMEEHDIEKLIRKLIVK
jgi:alcohol dehydrogenase class IV